MKTNTDEGYMSISKAEQIAMDIKRDAEKRRQEAVKLKSEINEKLMDNRDKMATLMHIEKKVIGPVVEINGEIAYIDVKDRMGVVSYPILFKDVSEKDLDKIGVGIVLTCIWYKETTGEGQLRSCYEVRVGDEGRSSFEKSLLENR